MSRNVRSIHDEPRYRVGCAGMFEMGMDYGVDDELDALAGCLAGPPGCEVLDTQTGEWIGPYCQEDADEIQARLAARDA